MKPRVDRAHWAAKQDQHSTPPRLLERHLTLFGWRYLVIASTGRTDSDLPSPTLDESPIGVSLERIGEVVTRIGDAGSPRVDDEQVEGTCFGRAAGGGGDFSRRDHNQRPPPAF